MFKTNLGPIMAHKVNTFSVRPYTDVPVYKYSFFPRTMRD